MCSSDLLSLSLSLPNLAATHSAKRCHSPGHGSSSSELGEYTDWRQAGEDSSRYEASSCLFLVVACFKNILMLLMNHSLLIILGHLKWRGGTSGVGGHLKGAGGHLRWGGAGGTFFLPESLESSRKAFFICRKRGESSQNGMPPGSGGCPPKGAPPAPSKCHL